MKNKLSKGLSLSLSVNPKHSISERFKASTHGFCHFLEKFESGQNALFSVILGHTLNVILGFIPRIHSEHSSLDTRVTPEYDNRKNFIKGLDVVRQCAALLERLKTHIKINSLFCHPWAWLLARPEDLDSRNKPENDNDIVEHSARPEDLDSRNKSENDNQWNFTKGLDVVRQCAALLERRVQSSTRVRKAQAVTRQTNPIGRSMIEMLGVLAIIGVLSVGGIQGFSKALDMYHWNKALGEWRLLINTLDRYRSQLHINDQTVANSEVSLVPILLAIGDLPNEMKIDNIDYLIKDSLNNKLFVYSHGTGYIGILSSNPKDNYAACHIFLTIGTYYHTMLERVQIYTNREENEETGRFRDFVGDSLCSKNNTNCLKDLGVAQIADICKNNPICKDRNNCNYLMYWF